MTVETSRIRLEPITAELARSIVARDERPGDAWHPEYPFADELDVLRRVAESTELHPVFGAYLVRRSSDGLAVGGLGFFGPPDEQGEVEFGYGLVPSARGHGLATEAVRAALTHAATHGARRAAAETEIGNHASRRVLEKAGLVEVRRDGDIIRFERDLSPEVGSPT
ncbi:GNAT family N-acetyltransferase [Agromyces sp. NPDC056523]|uniref:GNAT family N-acetyltransferase n=1 Tax=Agromyces sp. NPDC056523 TaxID=3345850 RepID=UPI00366B7A37